MKSCLYTPSGFSKPALATHLWVVFLTLHDCTAQTSTLIIMIFSVCVASLSCSSPASLWSSGQPSSSEFPREGVVRSVWVVWGSVWVMWDHLWVI